MAFHNTVTVLAALHALHFTIKFCHEVHHGTAHQQKRRTKLKGFSVDWLDSLITDLRLWV